MKKRFLLFVSAVMLFSCGRNIPDEQVRTVISLNDNWKFALGHAYDKAKDFNNGTSYFSYVTKAGYGDGPAAKDFDDRMWRTVNVPHDWCVELPFDPKGSVSHGSKAIGKNFPENSVGWYRRTFCVDSADFGKKFSIEFEGVFRNSKVWVNGFYLGEEHSGYTSFCYDITEYLNYGGENVVAVRADASFEEGWFYEGAGIYRNVNLIVTNSLHVARYGTFVTTEKLTDARAELLSRTKIENEQNQPAEFIVQEQILDGTGHCVSQKTSKTMRLTPHASTELFVKHSVKNPRKWEVWDCGEPNMYQVRTLVYDVTKKQVVDDYTTDFGIRTIAFDADSGFFLNGRAVKVRGVCLHQDHAGVGVAITPNLQEFRVMKMKEMGCNAIRTSHNPPSPDFLKVCDQMGMLVLDEVRLMGINQEHKYNIEQLMLRDRNHPSVFMWALGNEEWAIEGNETGARIAKNMEGFAHLLDSSRAFTIAASGGWENGIGKTTEVCGINYVRHGDVDGFHQKFPDKPLIGTEESNTVRTRGIYKTVDSLCLLAPINLYDGGMRGGWQFYDERPWASGLFYWTGLDYRGEPTPYDYPAVVSQFGITDLCGFPKDNFYYLKSWWTDKNVIHLATNWNYEPGTDSVEVVVYSNYPEVELFVNDKSVGKQKIKKNDYGVWNLAYEPGTICAKGYGRDGDECFGNSTVSTNNVATKLELEAYRDSIQCSDVAIVSVMAKDAQGNLARTANDEVKFTIDGDVDVVYVGNGHPSSHEPEVFVEKNIIAPIENLLECTVEQKGNGYVPVKNIWIPAFSQEPDNMHWEVYEDTMKVIKGTFNIENFDEKMIVTLFAKSIVENQTIYINGHEIKADIQRADMLDAIAIPLEYLKKGENEYKVFGQKFRKKYIYDEPNREPGCVQIVYPSEQPTRKLFNGLAQIIVRPKTYGESIKITAQAEGLEQAEIIIK